MEPLRINWFFYCLSQLFDAVLLLYKKVHASDGDHEHNDNDCNKRSHCLWFIFLYYRSLFHITSIAYEVVQKIIFPVHKSKVFHVLQRLTSLHL